MTTSAFYARLVELNNFLTYFPTATHDSKLSEEELIEILEFALPNTWRMHMTLGSFVCSEKTSREILNHCKEIKGLEAELGNFSSTGVHDTKRPRKPKAAGLCQNHKRKRDSESEPPNLQYSHSHNKNCPIHGPGHSADECHLLKNSICNGKKNYLDCRNKKRRYEKKQFTTEEVNVLIQAARAASSKTTLQVHRTATKPAKKIQFQEPETDLLEQVEKLHLYRETNTINLDADSASEASTGD